MLLQASAIKAPMVFGPAPIAPGSTGTFHLSFLALFAGQHGSPSFEARLCGQGHRVGSLTTRRQSSRTDRVDALLADLPTAMAGAWSAVTSDLGQLGSVNR
jgi:hypothetical protein